MNPTQNVPALRRLVLQSALWHPDWDLADHMGYLDSEWWASEWREDVENELPGVSPASAVLAWLFAARPAPGGECDGEWIAHISIAIPDDVFVNKCSGCGELLVIHKGQGTNFPPGTPIAEACQAVLGT